MTTDRIFISALVLWALLITIGVGIRLEKEKARIETQMRINELIIGAINDQAETNDLILDYLKTISKKAGQ